MHSFLDSFDAKLAESTDETPMAAGNDSVPTVLVCSSELFKYLCQDVKYLETPGPFPSAVIMMMTRESHDLPSFHV